MHFDVENKEYLANGEASIYPIPAFRLELKLEVRQDRQCVVTGVFIWSAGWQR